MICAFDFSEIGEYRHTYWAISKNSKYKNEEWRINILRLRNGHVLVYLVYLVCHIDFLANEWNYTVGDNHPVDSVCHFYEF